MATNTIDAVLLQKMFIAGAKNLESKKEWINDLNVFPVPDGDTGTNMTLTIMSAAKEVSGITSFSEALQRRFPSLKFLIQRVLQLLHREQQRQHIRLL